MATTDVRWYHNSMPGSPTWAGYAGQLNTVLKTVLIDGFNQHNVSSVTIDGAGVATVTTATAHGFPKHSVIRIEGADQAVLNDDWRVTVTNEFTFQFQTEEANLTGSGTMTAKVAPHPAWTVQAESGNNLALKSIAAGASGKTLVIEDDATQINTYNNHIRRYGWFSIVEDFVDFASPQVARGAFFSHMFNSEGNRRWNVYADSRMIIIALNPVNAAYTTYNSPDRYWHVYPFGDIVSVREDDTNDVLLINSGPADGLWNGDNDVEDSIVQPSTFGYLTNSQGKWMVRNSAGDVTGDTVAMFGSFSEYCGYGGFVYPNPANNEVMLSDIWVRDGESLRGKMPGVKQLVHTRVNARNAIIEAPDGNVYQAIFTTTDVDGFSTSSGHHGEAWVDIIGPWR